MNLFAIFFVGFVATICFGAIIIWAMFDKPDE